MQIQYIHYFLKICIDLCRKRTSKLKGQKVLIERTASSIRLNPHLSHLFVCAFNGEEHVAHVARDKDHGGEGHAPANPLAPGWEHIVTHGKRNHLHCTKQKDSLDKRDKKIGLNAFIFVIVNAILKSRPYFSKMTFVVT